MTRLYDDPHTSPTTCSKASSTSTGPGRGRARWCGRATETPAGKVAVVVGGGSGHYPAFCGVVGPGFADGAVVGNIFTSPVHRGRLRGRRGPRLRRRAAVQHRQLRRRRHELHPGPAAADRRGHRHPGGVRHRRHRQRAGRRDRASGAGSPGTSSSSRSPVPRPRRATTSTRSSGSPGTPTTAPAPWASPSPAARCPAPTIRCSRCPTGQMGVGLGIHGEPGVAEAPLPSAADLADPLGGRGAGRGAATGTRTGSAAILNGLGTTKYEELFVVWRHRRPAAPRSRLHRRGARGRRAGHQPGHGRCSLTLV